ncbi:hypothetical protein [Nostoc piscinale]|nr:hypothetical protein [Nostoc piscinale]
MNQEIAVAIALKLFGKFRRSHLKQVTGYKHCIGLYRTIDH